MKTIIKEKEVGKGLDNEIKFLKVWKYDCLKGRSREG